MTRRLNPVKPKLMRVKQWRVDIQEEYQSASDTSKYKVHNYGERMLNTGEKR